MNIPVDNFRPVDNFKPVKFEATNETVAMLAETLRKKLHVDYKVEVEGRFVVVTPPCYKESGSMAVAM